MSTKSLLLFIFIISLSLILILRFILYSAPIYQEGDQVMLTHTLLSEPKVFSNSQQFWVNKIWIVTSRFPDYHYGDRLAISGTLKKRVIDNNRQIMMLYFPKVERVKKDNIPIESGLAVTAFVRQKMTDLFQSTLPQPGNSLLLGIVLGVKENMDKTFFEDLRRTGTLHVVAASGMNVSMVGGFLFAVLALIFRRQLALALALLGLIFYALLSGFEPSIVRATLMGGLAFSAQILGRQNLPILALFLAGFLMLLIEPLLLFDIGFQLSILATLGLITLKPVFDRRIRFDALTTTLSAQLATLPILVANFGSFSLLSILANAIVLWTVPIVMVFGGIAAIIGLIFTPIAKLILLLSLPFLLFFEGVVRLFAGLPGVIVIDEFPLIIGVGYYLVLLSILLFLKKQ